ncbi:hypothetical protein COCVIDRAFT_106625 [Bipolaris victoriae FI3]|uniref:DUF1772 domain-containing protein n=1 Tax=Bipolaris victoriae (strain FI3) TaxID=930091 RepID=W7EB34_BIPV3|nr:hypothetical protein COCVIDRAFT_106625 [Bipolaris victoriae FI3]
MDNLLTQKTPTGMMVAQTVGITASMFLFGSNTCLSVVGIHTAMEAPAPLAVKQWYSIFTRGGAIARPLAILSALATGYVAYNQDPSSTAFRLNLASTILLPSIVPFTLLVIAPTNAKLMAKKDKLESASLEDKAVEANVAQGETVHELMDRWATLNMARTLLVGVGAVCTVLAAASKREVVRFGGMAIKSGANRL